MQNKKSLLKRLLFLYIALFLVIAAGLVHGLLGSFGRGLADGMEMGAKIAEKLQQQDPRMVYLLSNVPIREKIDDNALIRVDNTEITPIVSRMDLIVDEPATNTSPVAIAFRSIGGSPWMYACMMLIPLFLLAIIVLMILIIHSLRRSIREERPLDKRNVWYLRLIGLLTILTELINSLVGYAMKLQAERLLAGSNLTVDTTFDLSYTTIIMGILILFSAEVFAIGQNLSEEQKLTI